MYRRAAILLAVIVLLAGCDWTTYRGGPAHTGSIGEATLGLDNVSSLVPAWSADEAALHAPVIAGGFVYTLSFFSDYTLAVYAEAGIEGCGGTPKTCAPLWSADVSNEAPPSGQPPMPTVADGIVFASRYGDPMLAFDAAGETNCGGTPKVCEPLWSTTATADVTPTVSGGVLYAADVNLLAGDRLKAYDATGMTQCSGTPKVCQPLWTASIGPLTESAIPTVAHGRVFVATDDGIIRVFDADGVDGCSGIPKTCQPLVTLATGVSPGTELTVPAVAAGWLYLASPDTLFAFDADGTDGCGGDPLTCSPLWTAEALAAAAPGASPEAPAVAGEVVYQPSVTPGGPSILALSADGTTGCSGTPLVCEPLWTTQPIGSAGNVEAPVVANGVLYGAANITTGGGPRQRVVAYDAAGSAGCAGTPAMCSPVWSVSVPAEFDIDEPVIANGALYVTRYHIEPAAPSPCGCVTAFTVPSE